MRSKRKKDIKKFSQLMRAKKIVQEANIQNAKTIFVKQIDVQTIGRRKMEKKSPFYSIQRLCILWNVFDVHQHIKKLLYLQKLEISALMCVQCTIKLHKIFHYFVGIFTINLCTIMSFKPI